MNTYIYTSPFTRSNDSWINDDTINARPCEPFKNELITGNRRTFHDNVLDFQADFYKYSGIDIVSESVFSYPHPYISEKILRPILCKRPFILVAPHNTLKFLKDKGFKTFDMLVDESYDKITNPSKRLLKIQQEITKISEIPIDELKKILLKFLIF